MSNQATAEKTQEQAGNGFITPTIEETNLPAMGENAAQAIIFDQQAFGSVERMAKVMASGSATVPKHLQGNEGDCMAVIMQALTWGMNPWPVAQKTHLVNGTLGYEAQLVNAVVQASGAISGRFHYEYRGEGENLECRVGAVIAGETELTWNEWLRLSDVTTRNSPLWKTNPRQQIAYLQVKNWTRIYTPGAILGIYTPDELAEPSPREINPRPTGSDDTGGSRPRSRTNSVKDKARAKTQQRPPIDGEAEPVPQESAPAAEEQPATTWADMSAAIDEAENAEQLKAAVAHVDQLNDEERSRAKLSYTLRKGELQGLPVAIEVQDDVPHVVNTETGAIYA